MTGTDRASEIVGFLCFRSRGDDRIARGGRPSLLSPNARMSIIRVLASGIEVRIVRS